MKAPGIENTILYLNAINGQISEAYKMSFSSKKFLTKRKIK